MDWIAQKENWLETIKKYRYVLLAALIGIFLMTMPERGDGESSEIVAEETEASFEQSLSEILSKVSGAGEVEVLLTELEGESILYQSDEDITESNIRRNTVLITETDRSESGLVQQINPPVYRGAIVLCQGADNARVKLDIMEAVKSVTGLSADHITVLKMK